MTSWPPLLRDIVDFPQPGIVFRDITPVLADPAAFAAAIADLAAPWREAGLDAIVGIEARGFILGAALAQALGTGFAPIRKPGRLPAQTLSQAYSLEYGQGHLEMHIDALPAGARVLIVDDVLATGGTLAAALKLVQRQGADPVGAAVLVELTALAGRSQWSSSLPLLAAQAC